MSDNGLGDDLFGDSDNEAPAQEVKVDQGIKTDQAGPSRSRSPAVKPEEAVNGVKPERPEEEAVKDNTDDLFGSDDDEPPPPSPSRNRAASSPATSRSGSDKPLPNELEYEEQETEVEQLEERWSNHILPTWNRLGGTDGRVWHLKLPAYVNAESNPYDPSLYRAELDEEEVTGLAAKGRMIGVKNTMRWRWVKGPDGEYSNARVLRWSDGSVSLQLGSDLFDLATSSGASLARPNDPVPDIKPSLSQPAQPPAAGGSVTYICAVIPAAGVLMAEAPLAGQLSLVPTSMDSKTHMELVRHVGQQHTKHSRLKILDEVGDPEKADIVKSVKRRAQRSGERRRGGGSGMGNKGGGGGGGRKYRGRRGGSDDDDDNERERGRPVGVDRGDYEDDGFVVDDDDDEEEEAQDSDEEEEYKGKSSKGGGAAGGEKRRSNRKRKGSDEEEELDEIELAERDLEARERERKRAKKDKKSSNRRDKEKERKRKSRDYIDTDDEEDAVGEEEQGEGEEEMDMDMDMESEDD